MPRALTWTCHVCGRTRPDAQISVRSRTVSAAGVEVRQNVRYCNDRLDCVEGSRHVTWLGEAQA